MSSRNQSYVIYLLLFVAIIAMVVYSFGQRGNTSEVSINQLAADIKAQKVTKIEGDEDHLQITYKDLTEAVSTKESDATLVEQLLALGVTQDQLDPAKIKIMIQPPSAWLGVFTALGYILPFLLLIGAFFFIFRQAQGSNNAAMSFGKSRARMFTGDHPTVTFS
ncbi:MAG: ATP-dependent metallopeptidase FtsH/Yme1/Tma family protein, partial [Bellilinea sp.]